MKHINVVYSAFKSYLRFWHDDIYYKDIYTLGTENIPEDGTPLLIVSNHQNCLNDPLGVLFAFRDRKANFITRADVFALHPIANKFLRSIGLLPAFRLDHEGADALKNNSATFKVSEQALLNGTTVMLFPEAGHQDKHFLGNFSFGYTRLAFEAAEMGNFEKEIFILPSCNHYDTYFGVRNKLMIRFGTPISLKPFYELYKTKPRTAQREVNKLVRAQIESMMLDIRDLDNYDAIDFARETYGRTAASLQGDDPDNLPAKLKVDRTLVAALDAAKEKEPAMTGDLYREIRNYRKELEMNRIDDATLISGKGKFTAIAETFMEILLLPLWIFSLWPSLLMYWLPEPLSRRTGDKMFRGTFIYAINMLLIVPVTFILTFVLEGIYLNWWLAAAHVILLPFLAVFAWNYQDRAHKTIRLLRKEFMTDRIEKNKLMKMRNSIWDKLSDIMDGFRNSK